MYTRFGKFKYTDYKISSAAVLLAKKLQDA